MPFNWLLETYKWNRLIAIIQQFSLWKSFKIVLASLSFSLMTPNRVGDFAVRLVLIKTQHRWLVAYASFLSSFAQLSITIILGLLFFGVHINSFIIVNEDIRLALELVCFILPLIILILYIKSNSIKALFYKLNKEVSKNSTVLEMINSLRNRVLTLLLSLVRYLVFFLQFLLLALAFGENLNYELVSSISIMFLFTTVIPTSWLSEIAVRAGVSFYVFETFNLDPMIGLSCSICLWLINIFLPAIFGLVFLNRMNLKKNLK